MFTSTVVRFVIVPPRPDSVSVGMHLSSGTFEAKMTCRSLFVHGYHELWLMNLVCSCACTTLNGFLPWGRSICTPANMDGGTPGVRLSVV